MNDNNLNTLKVLFIIKAIINLLVSIFVLFVFLGLGAFIAADAANPSYNNEQVEMPFNLVAVISSIGVFAILISIAYTVVTFLAAKYIGERKNHTFIVVVSILNILSGILGLALGVFALIELHKDNVKPLFGRNVIEREQYL